MEYIVTCRMSEKEYQNFLNKNEWGFHELPNMDYVIDKIYTIHEVIDLLKTRMDIIYGIATFKYARLFVCLKQDNNKNRDEIFKLLDEVQSGVFPKFIKSKPDFKKVIIENDYERII